MIDDQTIEQTLIRQIGNLRYFSSQFISNSKIYVLLSESTVASNVSQFVCNK